jgi:acyl-CoA dehydrogenase
VFAAEARRIGQTVAAQWADEVDRDARFPAETVDALRASKLLGALVPVEYGGAGATVADMSAATAALSEYCATSGLLFGMHQIQVEQLAVHGTTAGIHDLLRKIAQGDVLLGNANSEVGLGGERRSSICALEKTGDGYRLDKRASTLSYGEYADGILATARREEGSVGSDQILAICMRPNFSLEPLGTWDTLGLRGTCSMPFHLVGDVPEDLILEDFATLFARTTLPVGSILLGSVWLGLAEAAIRQTHTSLRKKARAVAGGAAQAGVTTGPLRLAEAAVLLYQLRDTVAMAAAEYELHKGTPEAESLRFAFRMNSLKVTAATLSVDIVQRALSICGITGYQNGSDNSLARILRDVSAAPIMVNNDRVLQSMGEVLLMRKEV